MTSLRRLVENGTNSTVVDSPPPSPAPSTHESFAAYSNPPMVQRKKSTSRRLSLSRMSSIRDLEKRFRSGSNSSSYGHSHSHSNSSSTSIGDLQTDATANFYLGYSLGELCSRKNLGLYELLKQLNGLIKEYEAFKSHGRDRDRTSDLIRIGRLNHAPMPSDTVTGDSRRHRMSRKIFRQRGGSIATLISESSSPSSSTTLSSSSSTSSFLSKPGTLLRKASLSSLALAPMLTGGGSSNGHSSSHSISSSASSSALAIIGLGTSDSSPGWYTEPRLFDRYPLPCVPDSTMTLQCVCEALICIYEKLLVDQRVAESSSVHGVRDLTELLVKFDDKVNRYIVIPALREP